MTVETNRYADSFLTLSGQLPPYSRFREWKPTTVEEMKGFVTLQVEMGLDCRYNLRQHWSTRYLSPSGMQTFATNVRKAITHFSRLNAL